MTVLLLAVVLSACGAPVPTRSTPTADGRAAASGPQGEGLLQCENPEARPPYSLSYPADWFVHPADPAAEVPPCTYFGPERFDYAEPLAVEDAVESIVVMVFTGCVVEELRSAVSASSEVVDGFPATASEFRHGSNRRYNWKVEVHRGPQCDTDTTGFLQTASWMPGDYETNKAVLELMARSMDFLTSD